MQFSSTYFSQHWVDLALLFSLADIDIEIGRACIIIKSRQVKIIEHRNKATFDPMLFLSAG